MTGTSPTHAAPRTTSSAPNHRWRPANRTPGLNFFHKNQGTLPAVGCARRRPSRRLLSSPRLRLGPRRAPPQPGRHQLPGRGQRARRPWQQEACQGAAVSLAKLAEPVRVRTPRSNRGDFGTAGPAPALLAGVGAPTPASNGHQTDCRAGSATARPRAPRPESSAPDPDTDTAPTCTRHHAAERSEREERKGRHLRRGLPRGSSNGTGCGLWVGEGR